MSFNGEILISEGYASLIFLGTSNSNFKQIWLQSSQTENREVRGYKKTLTFLEIVQYKQNTNTEF